MAEAAPSTGKTAAIASFGTAQGITLLLYVVHKFGIDDMTPEVAASIIGFAAMFPAIILHNRQRKQEDAQVNNAAGVIGGPGAERMPNAQDRPDAAAAVG